PVAQLDRALPSEVTEQYIDAQCALHTVFDSPVSPQPDAVRSARICHFQAVVATQYAATSTPTILALRISRGFSLMPSLTTCKYGPAVTPLFSAWLNSWSMAA